MRSCNGTRDIARDPFGTGRMPRCVGAARPSVAEAHGAGHYTTYANRQHERRLAGKPAMQIGHAATGYRMIVVLDDAAQ